MKIVAIEEEYIEFDNGKKITYDQDCCERNYADFRQLDEMAMDVEFDEKLDFEECDYGFRFGNKNKVMFFVPCYSEQDGYYSHEVDIYFDGKLMITAKGDEA